MAGVTPVFILNNHLPAFEQSPYTTAEICRAAEQTSGFESIVGAQRIGGLWRIYPLKHEARTKLLIQGFLLRGVRVEVKDKNPYITTAGGEEKEIPATKVIVGNIPLSFSDDELMQTVKKLGVNVRSKLIAERDRDKDGKLTRWKTGRRFVYIDIPKTPLPDFIDIGPFKASLYHKEQKEAKKQKDTECRRCFQKGHVAASCTNPIKCRQCQQEGHVAGDAQCQLTTVTVQSEGEGENSSEREQPAPKDSDSTAPSEQTMAKDSRGRSITRRSQTKAAGKTQTKLKFRRSTSRSASSKRPRSEGTTPPQHMDKQRRQEKDGSTPDNDEAQEEDSDTCVK